MTIDRRADERAGEDPGAEGENPENEEKLPAAPTDDDTPAGDTDQHSSSYPSQE
jgi:hypothetical protein